MQYKKREGFIGQNNISFTLETILNYLRSLDAPVCSFFNKGLEEHEISNMFHVSGLKLTKEIIELYKWRNGTQVDSDKTLGEVEIIPGFHFLSLSDAISSYIAMKDDKRWSVSWFPIFANGGGDFYALELVKSKDVPSPIVGFMMGEVEQELEYESLDSMLLTFKECFEKEVVFKTKEGYLEMDDEKQAQIAKKHNPKIEFWFS